MQNGGKLVRQPASSTAKNCNRLWVSFDTTKNAIRIGILASLVLLEAVQTIRRKTSLSTQTAQQVQ